MRKTAALLLVLIGCCQLLSASPIDSIPDADRPKIGLVLSGGGAHGLAHIGVLRMLEELEIPIDYITGTSMGAIVGALASMGYTSQEIEALTLDMNWDEILRNTIEQDEVVPAEKLFHDNFPVVLNISKGGLQLPIGAVNSNNLDLFLTRLYSPAYAIRDFDDLPIPFKCNATDLAACEAIEIDEGPLDNAIRCSMSIPSVFSPVRDGEKLYVDGGVANNFPIEQVKQMGADIVIGSYVGAKMLNADELVSMADILKQVGFFQSLQDFKGQRNSLDVLILPDVKMVSSLNFELDEFFIEKGYEAAIDARNALIELRDSLNLQPREIEELDFFDEICIDEIVVEGLNHKMSNYLTSRLGIQQGEHVALDAIENGIHEIYGTKSFERLTYSLERSDYGENRLVLRGKQERKASLGLTLNRFKSTSLAIVAGVKLKNYVMNLSDINIHARISDFPGIFGRFTKRGNHAFANFLYGVDAKAEILQFPIYIKGVRQQENNLFEAAVSPFLMYEFNSSLSATLKYNYTYQRYGNRVNTTSIVNEANYKSVGPQLLFDYNSLNRAVLPTKGTHARFSAMYLHKVDFSFPGNDTFSVEGFSSVVLGASFHQVLPLGGRLGLDYRLGAHLDTDLGAKPMSVGGNEQWLDYRVRHIGLRESGLHSYNLAYANFGLRCRIGKSIYLTPTLSFVSAENNGGAIWGYGLEASYLSPLGPVSLSLGTRIDNFKIIPALSMGRRYIF